MGKYDALGTFLRAQNCDHIPLRFDEIERIVGTKLPASQEYPAWWSNSTSNNVMTQVWLDAGYHTEQVDIAGRKLVFRRTATPSPRNSGPASVSEEARAWKGPQAGVARHPAFGALKGMFTIEPGYDIASSDPEIVAEWDAAIERKAALYEAGRKRK